MGQSASITVKENSTIEVQFSGSFFRENETKIYNSEILRQFNVNRIFFDSGKIPFQRQPSIQPPKMYDFMLELEHISANFGRHRRFYVDHFVNEFVPRLARPGDVITLDGRYQHMRNGEVIFRLNTQELGIARRFYGTNDPRTVVITEEGFGTLVYVNDLVSRVEDYVLNVRRL